MPCAKEIGSLSRICRELKISDEVLVDVFTKTLSQTPAFMGQNMVVVRRVVLETLKLDKVDYKQEVQEVFEDEEEAEDELTAMKAKAEEGLAKFMEEEEDYDFQ